MPRQPPQRRPATRRGRTRTSPTSGRTPRTLFEISAGGVIYRGTGAGLEVCLIATRGATRWQLPKGKREAGESLEQTAVREVKEETGLLGRVGPRLDKVELWFTWRDDGQVVRHHKLVYFFLLEYVRGSTQSHDREVDEARWFPAAEALERLTFASERRVVARALDVLAGREAAPAAVSAEQRR